jgi:hypothetical protein
MALTLLSIVIAGSTSDVPAHRSVVLRHAGVAIRASVASFARAGRGDLAEFPRFTRDKPSLRSE